MSVFFSCSTIQSEESKELTSEVPTVSYVDLNKYIGTWYAITSLPQFFTRKCTSQMAEYQIIDSQTISVLNTCLNGGKKWTDIKGKAYVYNQTTQAHLKVQFDPFWFKLFGLKGDYRILKIDDDYTLSLVGSGDRKSLWLLARSKNIDPELKKEYINYAASLGYDTTKLSDSQFDLE